MNEDWVNTVLGALGGLSAVGLPWGAWWVSTRAQRATERNHKHDKDDKAIAQIKDIAVFSSQHWQEALDRIAVVERERAQDRREIDEMSHAVDTLRAKVVRLEGRLIRAVEYIRDLLAWARAVSASTPHPAVPDDIADLIDPDPK